MPCFRNVPVARKVMDEGGYHDFPSKFFFCLRVPEFFVGENFCAVFRKASGSEEPYA